MLLENVSETGEGTGLSGSNNADTGMYTKALNEIHLY